MPSARAILVTGVSGSGKSSVAAALARHLSGTFLDADDFHPPENVRKMAAGEPLTDADRIPWLARLAGELNSRRHPPPVVLACSALKRTYREALRSAIPALQVIYLRGSYELILRRMQARRGHFMKAAMLESQFSDLEEPRNALTVEIDQSLEAIIDEILAALAGR